MPQKVPDLQTEQLDLNLFSATHQLSDPGQGTLLLWISAFPYVT